MMQKILAGRAALLLAGIQSQLSEESLVTQSEELPPEGKVDKNVTFYLAAGFVGRRGSLAVFGVIKRHFVNSPSALDTTTVPLNCWEPHAMAKYITHILSIVSST